MNTSIWVGAAIGALVAAVINGLFNWKIKREEIRVQRLGIALKCAELKTSADRGRPGLGDTKRGEGPQR